MTLVFGVLGIGKDLHCAPGTPGFLVLFLARMVLPLDGVPPFFDDGLVPLGPIMRWVALPHTPGSLVHASLAPGASLTLPWQRDYNALVYVMAGRGSVGADHRPPTPQPGAEWLRSAADLLADPRRYTLRRCPRSIAAGRSGPVAAAHWLSLARIPSASGWSRSVRIVNAPSHAARAAPYRRRRDRPR